MAIVSAIPGNPVLWTFLMQNFNLGIAKMSVIPQNPLFLYRIKIYSLFCQLLGT